MNKKRLLFVFGTRPEFIKMAPLIHEAKSRSHFDVITCFTGQHKEMVHNLLEDFDLTIDIDLKLMTENQSLGDFSGRMFQRFGKIVDSANPDLVLVHGDTISAALAAMFSFYSKFRVVHVEAGLRTGDLNAPFPEEFNRRIIALSSSIHLAPTNLNRNNLVNEGISPEDIVVTGNTGVDAQLFIIQKLSVSNEYLEEKKRILSTANKDFSINSKYVLITAHRRESFGKPILSICAGISELSKAFPNIGFVYPVHLNPNIWDPVNKSLSDIPNVFLMPPIDYSTFMFLLKECFCVLSDSGGIQEEAPTFGKKVFVMRDVTERIEALEKGYASLVGTDSSKIYDEVSKWLKMPANKIKLDGSNPFGNGMASDYAMNFIEEKLEV
tara:strand:- start:9735 stop:10880 length:1146 start_codon:yes stop_codon:yes gene_type:complete